MDTTTKNRLYIKDGTFMLKDNEGNFHHADYISIEKIKKRLCEIVENIENIEHPNLNSLIMKAIKDVTKFKIVSHCKIASNIPNCQIKFDDPLYAELVKYIQNLPAYREYLEHTKKTRESINKRCLAAKKAKQTENDFFSMYMENKQRRLRRRNIK